MRKANKIGIVMATAICVVGIIAAAGCSHAEDETPDPNVVTQYLPEVVEQADGTLIQRTPSEDVSPTEANSALYNHPEKDVPYNTYYAKADERGCNACHDDLAETLDNMPYGHVSLKNDLGIEITVQQCLDCHSEGPGYQTVENSFGTLIHGIHNTTEKAACWNCHNATNDGDGMQLWDVVKHQQLRGITPIENVEGAFSFSQDETIPTSSIFDFNWQYYDLDYMRADNTAADVPLDEQMFNDWTITVTGEVHQEVTYQLTDLIAEAPVETVPLVMQCTYNPTGGPLIAQSMVTGIPLDWLLDKAGLTDKAASISAVSPDGNANSASLSTFKDHQALLVYKIDGEKLPWRLGYPVQLWVGGAGAPVFVKEVSDLIVNNGDEAADDYEGWAKSSGGFYNKPNVGIFNLDEGQVLSAGQPYTVKGYASAWDDPIAALEFSLDGGQTWSRYDTPSTNTNQWVTWDYTIDPPADANTAYVLSVRAVSASGLITEHPVEKLFNTRAA